ncbi:hypothetical protein B0T10DRAFT_465845 [Thelonectria olida]|uniref:Uncharacterized protein n=1 Tax=Thelonectria olida TaxID=1576542 RepID=A0A9P8VS97_9HYPO|nr:hypothetical protein B0T10DRAFT_466362 [Thelonectria olida]KAH6874170.1 hypothetical protein B0T10DRAFT_465845 [Thelonectria olida]
MSMAVIVQPDCPSGFAYPDKHHIKGLNAETIARACIPLPSWIMATEYITLQSDPNNLHLPQLDPSDWANGWFLMNGRVRPDALTWEIEQDDGSESEQDIFVECNIPALVIRDQSYVQHREQ